MRSDFLNLKNGAFLLLLFLVPTAGPSLALGAEELRSCAAATLLSPVRSFEISSRLSSLWLAIPQFKPVRKMDSAAFLKARNQYLEYFTDDDGMSALAPVKIEDQLALIEAICGASRTLPISFDQIVLGTSPGGYRDLKWLVKLVKKQNFKKGLTALQLENFLVELYAAVHAHPDSIWNTPDLARVDRILIAVRRRLSESVATNGSVETAGLLGFARTGDVEKNLRRFIEKNRLPFRLSLILNEVLTAGLPGSSRWLPFPEKLLRRALMDGIDDVRPEFDKLLVKNGYSEDQRRRLRPVVAAAAMVTLAHFVVETLDARLPLRWLTHSEKSALGAASEGLTMSLRAFTATATPVAPPASGQVIFDAWRAEWLEDHGKAPPTMGMEYRLASEWLLTSRE